MLLTGRRAFSLSTIGDLCGKRKGLSATIDICFIESERQDEMKFSDAHCVVTDVLILEGWNLIEICESSGMN